MARIAIIGTGYVGLTSGACFASIGHDVICVDVDSSKIDSLKNGKIPIFEPGLDDLVHNGVSRNCLSFTTDAKAAVSEADFVFLCVPTPEGEDGHADLSYVTEAAKTLSSDLRAGAIVVNKSTVPVGSTVIVENALRRTDVYVVSNPEFLREGSAIHDFLNPDRIVVGSVNRDAALDVANLYQKIDSPVIVTDPASAETIKYAANAFLATKISYINAVAAICEGVGADIKDVATGLGLDQRIGKDFLKPGPGWGGSCFPKDTKALVKIAEKAGYDFGLLKGVITVNEQQLHRIVKKIKSLAGSPNNDEHIAVLGLTFKADTDDLRDSPALVIVRELLNLGYRLKSYDPTVKNAPVGIEQIEVCSSARDAYVDASVVAILTEWQEFKSLDSDSLKSRMRYARVVDARNLLDKEQWSNSGFTYVGIGR